MKTPWVPLVVCFMATSCDVDPGTPSGNVPNGDAFPMGAVSFFNRLSCPPDWAAFDEAAGRVIIAASTGLPRGTAMGDPLSSGEDRVHAHGLSGSIDVPIVQSPGSQPGPNGTFTTGGAYPFAGTSMKTAAGVPYRQLLVCKKMAEPEADALPLPTTLHMYFDLDGCPSGWKQATTAEGRILIGLPPKAPPDMPMGGEPIVTSEPRTHTHTFSSTLAPASVGYPQSPCATCESVGGLGSYTFTSKSDPAAVDIPMIALLHCEKQ